MKLKNLVAAVAAIGMCAGAVAADQSTTMSLVTADSYTGYISVTSDLFNGGSDLLSFLLPTTATAGTYFVTFAYSGQNVSFASVTLNGLTPSITNSGGVPGILTYGTGFGSGVTTPPFSVSVNGSSQPSSFGIPSFYGVGVTASLVQAAPVPEPETYAMFLAGLGLIGAVARRRMK